MDPMTNNVPFDLSSDGQFHSWVTTYTCWIQFKNIILPYRMPHVRIELTTAGLQDQCSTTELKRLAY